MTRRHEHRHTHTQAAVCAFFRLCQWYFSFFLSLCRATHDTSIVLFVGEKKGSLPSKVNLCQFVSPLDIVTGHIHYKTTYACEGKQLDLSCSDGQMIHLVRANYGRFSLSICNPSGQIDLSVNCMSYKSYLIMQDRCSQSSNCSIVVSSKTFGDPCPGTSKYLEVQYHCAHPTSVADTVAVNGGDINPHHHNNNTGANLGASTATTAPVIVTTRKSPASSNRDSDTFSSSSSSSSSTSPDTGALAPPPQSPFNGQHATVATSLKAPYETSSSAQQINNNNSASISATTTITSVVSSPSRGGANGTPPSASVSSSRSIAAVVTFRPNEPPPTATGGDHHPYHVSPKVTRPVGGSQFPTEIIGDKFNPRQRAPVPPVPETSLPPWLETANGDSNYAKTLDDLFGGKDSSGESSSSSSDVNNASPVANDDDDDGMMSMAIALFFIVFFLVLATFGLIYCILRSDHVRSRKLVSRIPFITCLFGPDISSDVEVEKVSSVVQSSAYGTTSGTSGPVSFPIIATRVPTQITSTSATGFESPSSSASSLNVKGANCSLGVSSTSNQQQLTSPVRLIHVNSPASTGSAWNFPSSLPFICILLLLSPLPLPLPLCILPSRPVHLEPSLCIVLSSHPLSSSSSSFFSPLHAISDSSSVASCVSLYLLVSLSFLFSFFFLFFFFLIFPILLSSSSSTDEHELSCTRSLSPYLT